MWVRYWLSDIGKVRKKLTQIKTDIHRCKIQHSIKELILLDIESIIHTLNKGRKYDKSKTNRPSNGNDTRRSPNTSANKKPNGQDSQRNTGDE